MSSVQAAGYSGGEALAATFGGRRPAAARLKSVAAFLFVLVVLLFFWQIRDEGHLTPESGLGYWLGIAGATAMVLLLTYPLRKRIRLLRRWGSMEAWFRAHMVLGLIAPALILMHSNFKLGSLNATVALLSMLVVAASGIVGRFIYRRIHFGLYGSRATLVDLRSLVAGSADAADTALRYAPAARDRLLAFGDVSLSPAGGVLGAAARIVLIGPGSAWLGFRLRGSAARSIRRSAKKEGWPAAKRRMEVQAGRLFIRQFMAAVRKTVQFTFYERMFALWHIVHVPLFFILIGAVIAHVVAVHMY